MGGLFSSQGSDNAPLLEKPDEKAPVEEWVNYLPISMLPKLPPRGEGYWAEPWGGICLVGVLCFVLVSATHGVATAALDDPTNVEEIGDAIVLLRLVKPLIWSWAALATLSTAYIIFGAAGEIRRSPQTCYPIPYEVTEYLSGGRTQGSLTDNVRGQNGASYCVRCFVWREGGEERPHHCSICQRCYTGFDHHCGVFGRCIVNANMPCFVMNLVMLCAGLLTCGLALVMSSGNPAEAPVYYVTSQMPLALGATATTTAPYLLT